MLHKRPDGFHEVEMIMTTVDLADRVWLRPTDDGQINIKASERFVPNDRKNLAYQAAELLKRQYGIREGVEITLEKRIPVAAGLAGGSSDAAATLRGLNRLWNLGLVRTSWRDWCKDWFGCVFLCSRRNSACAGRGEKIQTCLPRPIAGSFLRSLQFPFRLQIFTAI